MKPSTRLTASLFLVGVVLSHDKVTAEPYVTEEHQIVADYREIIDGPRPLVTRPELSQELTSTREYLVTRKFHKTEPTRLQGVNAIDGVEYKLYSTYPVIRDPASGKETPFQSERVKVNNYSDDSVDYVVEPVEWPRTMKELPDGSLEEFEVNGLPLDEGDMITIYRIIGDECYTIPVSNDVVRSLEATAAEPLVRRLDPVVMLNELQEYSASPGVKTDSQHDDDGKLLSIKVSTEGITYSAIIGRWNGDFPESLQYIQERGGQVVDEIIWELEKVH